MAGSACTRAVILAWLVHSCARVWGAIVRPVPPVNAAVSISRPPLPASFNFTMAQFGAMPYGRAFNARVFMPRGLCGSVPCSSGCAEIDTYDNPTPSKNTAWVYVLPDDSRFPCSDVQRAFHAQQHGASAVLFIPLTDNVYTYTEHIMSALNKNYLDTSIMLPKIQVPSGRIDLEGGRLVLDSMQQSDHEHDVELHFDFRSVAQRVSSVWIDVWHNTADSCGPLCDLSRKFLSDLAEIQRELAPEIHIDPRFMFNTCNQVGSHSCNMSCAVGGRFCVYQPGAMHLPGRPAALENLRQLCLRDVLAEQVLNLDVYWLYVLDFQQECKSKTDDFTLDCSERVFDRLGIQNLKPAWRQCFSGLEEVAAANATTASSQNVSSAEHEFKTMLESHVTPHEGVEVHINGVPFRGLFNKDQVLRAACSQLANPEAVKACQTRRGFCAPDSQGALVCREASSAKHHTTTCVEDAGSTGFRCTCGPGFLDSSAIAGAPHCVDSNECLDFSSLCGRLDSDRNACVNTPGHYDCELNVRNECNAQAGWGQCWAQELGGGAMVSSCRDRIGQYKSAAILGFPDGKPSISECSCEEIYGCWSQGRGRTCVQECPDNECNTYTKKCLHGSKTRQRTRHVVLAVTLSCMGLVLLVLVGTYVARRRRAAFNRDRAADRYQAMVSARYAGFRDGMDGEEMADVSRNGSLLKNMLSSKLSSGPFAHSGAANEDKPADPTISEEQVGLTHQ